MATMEAHVKKLLSSRERKYDDTFLLYGCICNDEDVFEKPLCLICSDILSAEYTKPSKLKGILIPSRENISTNQQNILKDF